MRLFALYGGLVATAYLVHLSALVFLATIVAVSGLVRLRYRSTSLRREMLLFVPIVVMFAWHFGVAEHYRRPTDLAGQEFLWGTLSHKVQRTMVNFHRYGDRLDLALEYLYVVCLLMLIRSRGWRDAFSSPRVIESLAVAAAFFGMYFTLPFAYDEASYIDIRALAPATLFVLLACLNLPRAEPSPGNPRRVPAFAALLALVLSLLNLGYLGKHFVGLSGWGTKYRAIFAAIPRGARVLPVYTVRDIYRYMEPSPIMVIDRQALLPYLFSANAAQPMTYFRYVDLPYRPADDWYRKDSPLVDWPRIACTYQYILVTQPFDVQRIRIATHPVAETSSAALLAIDPAGHCGG